MKGKNVHGLVTALNINHNPERWILFIDFFEGKFKRCSP
jgi:hypothetical protein